MARNDTAQFIRDVIRDAKVPAGSSYRTEATLLSLASDEMEQLVVPELLKVTGGHLMAFQDVALVAGKTRYRFPDRCIRPERLQIVTSDGKLIGKLHSASGDLVDEVLAGRCPPPGTAMGYWVAENNHAVLVLQRSDSSGGGRLLRTYYRRQPNRLTTTSSCVKIMSYEPPGAVAAQIIFGKINAADSLATIVEEEPYDIIKAKPTFEASAEDCTFQSIVSPAMESLTGITAAQDIAVGDYIAPAGYTPVPQLPVAFYGILVDYTVARILGPTDKAGAQAALDSAARKIATALSTITPRGEETETTVDDVWM